MNEAGGWPEAFMRKEVHGQLRTTCSCASTWCKGTSSPRSTGRAKARVGGNVLKVVLGTTATRPSTMQENWCHEGNGFIFGMGGWFDNLKKSS